MRKRPTVLMVLDGFGFNPNPRANAVAMAKKPNIDRLLTACPNSTLTTHGMRVGLPEGVMGNSEVGHLNIGAGRVVEQWLLKIGRALEQGSLNTLKQFTPFLKNVKRDKVVHVIGLFSEGGVHSHADHLYKLLNCLLHEGYERIALHLLTDGRDTAPQCALRDLERLNIFLKKEPRCFIASICGRFYAMDRDKRWERIEPAYRAIVEGSGNQTTDAESWISNAYKNGVTDEFIEPAVVKSTPITQSDGIIFWNFRADRMREIVSAVTQPDFNHFKRSIEACTREQVICFTQYDPKFGLPYLFDAEVIENHLGEVIAAHKLTQLRTAETEKYPHVTYFFNGGSETASVGEERQLVPSPRDVKTYDLKPEMSAHAVKDVVLHAINEGRFDLIVVNFANCDMVGHTGVLEAAIKAVETVDSCVGEILMALDKCLGQALIIADHGNAEQMINYETGEPHTAHTTHPVPVIIYGYLSKVTLRADGALCDVAPTILQMMGLKQPSEMSGKSLIAI